MLRYLRGSQLASHPKLANSMFRHRAVQFRDRLGWDVTVNAQGHEKDSYDALDPLYVIWQQDDGCHGGSMRFLPTTGPTMVNEHFSDLIRCAFIAARGPARRCWGAVERGATRSVWVCGRLMPKTAHKS